MEWRYGIFDNLNLKWSNIAGQPLTLIAGRQDILIGEFPTIGGCCPMAPLRLLAFFLDAIRLTYEAKDIKTKFDLIYIHQNAEADEWIPRGGAQLPKSSPRYPGTDHPLTEQDEQGVVFYVSNKSFKNTTIDGYFIYKSDDQTTLERRGVAWRPVTTRHLQRGPTVPAPRQLGILG